MQVAIIKFPGSNRENDLHSAFQLGGASNCQFIDARDHCDQLGKFDILALPGGFSYGDYLRPGALAARLPIITDLIAEYKKGKFIIGICNGFQILTAIGILPGTLLANQPYRFSCRMVTLTQCVSNSLWLAGYKPGQTLRLPIAHQTGRYFADAATCHRLAGEGQIAWRYGQQSSEQRENRPATGAIPLADDNPNGSSFAIAGVSDASGRVLGVMPHPENAIIANAQLQSGSDGLTLFHQHSRMLPRN